VRFQSNKSSCGAASLHNALSALGISRSEDELIKLCKQTASGGTTVQGLLGAMRSIPGVLGEPTKWRNDSDAIVGVWYQVSERGRPVIMCVDNWDHWVVCTGHLGPRFGVVDSADNALVIYYDGAGLVKRWRHKDKRGFYGIVV
jgi:hypothetical protein